MSGESVTDILKLISSRGSWHSPLPLSIFAWLKKRPGVCKRVVGASAYTDSLTYWLFKPLRLSHGTRVMNVSSPTLPSLPHSRFLPLSLSFFIWKSGKPVTACRRQTCCLESRGDQWHRDSYTAEALFRHNPPNARSSLATSCMELVSSGQAVYCPTLWTKGKVPPVDKMN